MLLNAPKWLVAGFGLILLPAVAAVADDVQVPIRRVAFQQQEGAVNERANLLRSQADEAYQRGDYKKTIDLCNQLLQQFKDDNPHVAYHLRASAKIELGRQSREVKQIREGIADSRSALAAGGGKFPWLNVPYIYGMTALGEQIGRAHV